MAISKKVRFEIFKRDSFACQYCGQAAPDVVLNLDHIHPRSKGGNDDILNLITSCYDCNQGKKDRELSDDSVLQKRKAQLDLLQERREQLDMMMQWQRGLSTIEDSALEQLADYFGSLMPGYSLNVNGLTDLRKMLKKFSIPELSDAMRTSVTQYGEIGNSGKFTEESVQTIWHKVGAIAAVNKRCQEKPYLRDLYYVRGILRNRLSYINERQIMTILEWAVQKGVPPEEIKQCAVSASSWTNFNARLDQVVTEIQGEM